MEAEEETTEIKNKPNLENQGLGFLQEAVSSLASEYGWYVLFTCIAVYFIVQLLRRKGDQTDRRQTPQDLPDKDVVVKRQAALEAARKRMQEELDAKAEQYKEKQQQIAEEKRQQKIEMWDNMQQGKSYKAATKVNNQSNSDSASSPVSKPKSEKKPLRGGYNPLTGDSGGTCSWRPGRRGPSAGG